MSSNFELSLRLGIFSGILLVLSFWELLGPRRRLAARKPLRWASNLSLLGINTLLVRLIVPITAVGVALFAENRQWGVLRLVDAPVWLEIVIAVLALDLAIYVQHVMFHAIPVLWRLHMVHHADLDFDVTTGLRFHSLEIVLSSLIKIAVVMVLGASAVAVVIFEILLNATSMFNHSNVRMPAWLDRLLLVRLASAAMTRQSTISHL